MLFLDLVWYNIIERYNRDVIVHDIQYFLVTGLLYDVFTIFYENIYQS